MPGITRIACLLLIAGLNSPGYGQQTSIEDFGFLTGYWTGSGLGGEVEEVWMPPVDGRMFGIFMLSSEGELVFSEYMEIVAENGEFQLRLKHFNADFSGWESPDKHVSFPLQSVRPDEAHFRGLSYRVSDGKALEIVVTLHQDDGSSVDERLYLTRKALSQTSH